jgi:hypothetical protein
LDGTQIRQLRNVTVSPTSLMAEEEVVVAAEEVVEVTAKLICRGHHDARKTCQEV